VGGEGKIGFAPSIRNRDFLALASDDFIRSTVHNGRSGTAMMPRPDLSEQVVDDIIAYLRDLSVENRVDIDVDPALSFEGDASKGSEMYSRYCASCHGPNGEGYAIGVPGTGIGLPGFANASDDYIFKTLKHGRIGTPMKSFIGARGLANLSNQDAYDIIAHLRTLQSQPLALVEEESLYE
jgi:cytochrome c553